MHRIDGPGATVDNKFTDGNPSTGVPSTRVMAAWLTSVQEEIANVVLAANYSLDKAVNTQLRDAIFAIASSGGAGEANTTSNVGTGAGTLALPKVGVNLPFKTLKAGANVTITNNANEIVIAAAVGGGSGEVNTASNLGSGFGVFYQKNVYDLQFKSLKAGAGVSISATNSEITITATGTAAAPATETVAGVVELATPTETAAGIDTTRAIHPAGAAATYAKLTGATFTGTVSGPAFNTIPSTRTKKTDIETISSDMALSLLLGTGFYKYRIIADGSRAFGVIAEELVGGPLDFVVGRDEKGDPESVNYQPLFVLACAALHGLAERLSRLESVTGG